MVLPLIVLGLAAGGATTTLVLDLFLKRPFLSAAVGGFLPPTAILIALEPGHLDWGFRIVVWAVAALLTAGPAFAVAFLRRPRRLPRPRT